MTTDEHDLETWLRRTAEASEPPPTVPGADVRRGVRALRRRRAAAGASLAAVAAVGIAATTAGLSAGTSRTAGEVAGTTGPTGRSSAPTVERPPGSGLQENVAAEEVVSEVLGTRGEVSFPPGAASGTYDDAGRLVAITPLVSWQGPGMAGPGTVAVTVAASGTGPAWQCSADCTSQDLAGGLLRSGRTDAGRPTWRLDRADGRTVAVTLDFPDGAALPEDLVRALLTSPRLAVPDLRLTDPVTVHRALVGAASEVASGRWNVRTVGERESDTWLDAIAQQDGRDHGLVRIEVVDPTGGLDTCGDDLADCRVAEVDGLTVRRGTEVEGPRAGWLRVEADRSGHRVRVLLQPGSDGTAWSVPEDLARRVLLSGAWSSLR